MHPLKISVLLLLLFFTSSEVLGQQLSYDAFRGDSHIGTLTVTRSETNGEVHYASVTDLTVTYVISIDLDFNYSACYRNGNLHSTSFKYLRNQKIREKCHGKLSGRTFHTYFDDRTQEVNMGSLAQCLLASYFEEPVNKNAVFSERWGVNIPLEYIGNDTYKIVLPDGKESHMVYSEGLCQQVTIVSGWGDIVFQRT